jgi:nickel/cobalt transporter (NicO) family protein
VLRSRIRARRAHAAHHGHAHDHPHSHAPSDLSWRGLVGMGTSAGLIPCPSALVVLLGAISQHEVALGLLLITAFSAGLAATLSGLGLAVVHARSLLARLKLGGEFAAVVPSLSAVVIVAAGILLTAHGIGQVH